MATRTDDVNSTNLTTALGGTVTAGDTVRVRRYATEYTVADLSGTDLLELMLGSEFRGAFASAAAAGAGAQLKLVCNQTSTGVFKDLSNASRVELVSTSSTGVIYEVWYSPANGHTLSVNTCDTQKLYTGAPGSVIVGAACDLDSVVANFARVFLAQTASAATFPVTSIIAGNGAIVDCERDAGSILCKGGEGGPGTVRLLQTDCTPGTITMDGGRLVLVRCGAISTLTGESGVVDMTQLGDKITISTQSLGPGVTILKSRKTVDPTITTTTNSGSGPVTRYVD